MSRAALGPARTGRPGPARVPRSSPGASAVGSVLLTRAQHVTSAGTRQTTERPREVLPSLRKSCLARHSRSRKPAVPRNLSKAFSRPASCRARPHGLRACHTAGACHGGPGAPAGLNGRQPPAREVRDANGPCDGPAPSSLPVTALGRPPGQPRGLSGPPPWARLRARTWTRPGEWPEQTGRPPRGPAGRLTAHLLPLAVGLSDGGHVKR